MRTIAIITLSVLATLSEASFLSGLKSLVKGNHAAQAPQALEQGSSNWPYV